MPRRFPPSHWVSPALIEKIHEDLQEYRRRKGLPPWNFNKDTPMDEQTLIEQVKYQARLYGIDPALACAVVEQESGWDVWATRYEPAFFLRYVSHQVNLSDTERQTRSTSWGLFQTMGQVARERGFKQKWLVSLCDPDFGIPVGCEFLKHCLDSEGGDVTKALLRWNGGSNTLYADQVIARMPKYA